MSDRRRLLIIGPLPPPYAGPEVGVQTLVTSPELNERYEVRSLNTTLRASNRDKGKVDLTMLAAYPRYLWRLLVSLLFFRPHCVLYCPTSATLKGWVRDGSTCLACWLLRKRLFVQFRGGHFRLFFDRQSPPLRALVGWLLRRCRGVIVQADRLRPQFEGIVDTARIHKLPNSLGDAFFVAFDGAPERRSVRSGPLRVLFVGHLSHAKGYCDLLKVIPGLTERHDVEFDFIGVRKAVERNVFFDQTSGEPIRFEDPEEVFEAEIGSRGLEGKLHFHGDRVFDQAKLDRFEAADVFVLPSYSEGFSMAILEALGAGLPIVATPVGAAPEILIEHENGFLPLPGRLEDLEASLGELLSDAELRRRMGVANRALCGAQYRTGHASKTLIGVLEGLDSDLDPTATHRPDAPRQDTDRMT